MKGIKNELVAIVYNITQGSMILVGILFSAMATCMCSTMYITDYTNENMKSITEAKALQLEMAMEMNLNASGLVSALMHVMTLLYIIVSWYIIVNESKLQSFEGSIEERNEIVTKYWNSNIIVKLAYISAIRKLRKNNEEEYYKRTIESSSFKAWYTWKDKGGKYWIIYLTCILLLIILPLSYELYLLLL